MLEDKNLALSKSLVALFKGSIDRDDQPNLWETILKQRTQAEDYVSKLGLTVIVDENDGYCFLKQKNYEDDSDIPRLIPRHQLSYPISLLLLLLRKQMLDFDAKNNEIRLITTKQEIIDKMLIYMKSTSNEVKQNKEIESYIKRVEELGFIRKLKNSDDEYEVSRIIRSFIDAEWLNKLDEQLEIYIKFAISEMPEGELDNEHI